MTEEKHLLTSIVRNTQGATSNFINQHPPFCCHIIIIIDFVSQFFCSGENEMLSKVRRKSLYKGWLPSAKLKPTFTFLGRDFAIFNTFGWQNPYQERWKLVLALHFDQDANVFAQGLPYGSHRIIKQSVYFVFPLFLKFFFCLTVNFCECLRWAVHLVFFRPNLGSWPNGLD